MPKQKRKQNSKWRRMAREKHFSQEGESQASEATTVAWTVSVTMVLLCDIAAALAHLYGRAYPDVRGVAMFNEFLLYSAAAIGAISLLLLAVVLRVRGTPPPTGVTVFGICVAAAPILAILARDLR